MSVRSILISWVFIAALISIGAAQDNDDPEAAAAAEGDGGAPKPPKEAQDCNGIFASYISQGREKEYPYVKNATAQSWAFKATATVINMGAEELKSWQLYVGFQHDEILVTVDGGAVVDGEGSPVHVGKNGTILAGSPQSDLKTAIDTANDLTQMQAQVKIKGTQFGGAAKDAAMPKTIKLVNPEYKCPAPAKNGGTMHVCCKKDPKFKKKEFGARQYGDLHLMYDVLQADSNKYLAQVTINNNHPLGRLDQWNLTWTWMRNEFIYTMKGAYTHEKGASDCINGPQGHYYKDFDFTNVVNCQKSPLIADLPSQLENDDKLGKLPYCCKNGVLLPKSINETQSRAIFQMQVFKLPPDLDRNAITPPQNWRIVGRVNPTYKCGPPLRVEPTEFPDPMGLDATVPAIASWQVTCNITRPKPKQNRCCVSYSAYYADAAVSCDTCACGCDGNNDGKCDANAPSMLLPVDALLVPFANRTAKAKALAQMHHHKIPKKLPCPDNCGVSVNWHVDSDYKNGWTVRVTIFNWEEDPFADWYAAVQMKPGYKGFVRMHSFNATKVPTLHNTIMFRGTKGNNYLVGETNSSHPDKDPPVPGKQQTAITFSKAESPDLDVVAGDGFPAKLIFNGEECALPTRLPKRNGAAAAAAPGLGAAALLIALFTSLLLIGTN
ncbi:COBRA-like protein 10 [Andrographis paniculata]|uniref:COBRA-like protein 10 n=1 Tax=Andrographis paniculata TaxID=175694 RepID=UPI0021E961C3|nr:COBRA-like protein 10 [Andrographis paniculata]